MNRSMRAEMYRFLHSNHLTMWLTILCLIFVAMSGLSVEDVFSLSMSEMLSVCGDTCLFMNMFVSVFPAVVVGLGYMRKTACYEVMAGNKISHILCSKVIVDAVPVAVLTFISVCIIPVMVYLQNGMGEATQVVERFALYFVVLLHVCVSSVLMTTALKHIIATVAIYMRFAMLDLIGLFILSIIESGMSVVPVWFKGLRNWFVMSQVSSIFYGALTSELVVAVFGSFLLEVAVLYIASYIGMKKKIYS